MQIIVRNTSLKDKSGERVWFPKDGKPYFDQGLRTKFNTPQEKKAFMDKHNIVDGGSDDLNRKKLERTSKELCDIDRKKLERRK